MKAASCITPGANPTFGSEATAGSFRPLEFMNSTTWMPESRELQAELELTCLIDILDVLLGLVQPHQAMQYYSTAAVFTAIV